MKDSAPILIRGDARALPLPDDSVDLIVTSPPYFGLRDYGTDGQLGAEPTPSDYIKALMECTAEMVRVLKPSGSIFVNLGDKYSGYNNGSGKPRSLNGNRDTAAVRMRDAAGSPTSYGVPNKSLMLLPERYRIATVDELGLIARAVIIWRKRPAMPAGRIRDRVHTVHEDWVHLTRTDRYYHNAAALLELGGGVLPPSVWDAPVAGGLARGDHPAMFPMEWPRRLIQGWCPPGGTVLDPFGGAATTALVAAMNGRLGISVDLSEDYTRLAAWRVQDPKQRAKAAGIQPSAIARVVPLPVTQPDLFEESS